MLIFLETSICLHHFTSEEIEATIIPNHTHSVEDFTKLIEFLDNIANVLNLDRWYIRPENYKDVILVNRIISLDQIKIASLNSLTYNT